MSAALPDTPIIWKFNFKHCSHAHTAWEMSERERESYAYMTNIIADYCHLIILMLMLLKFPNQINQKWIANILFECLSRIYGCIQMLGGIKWFLGWKLNIFKNLPLNLMQFYFTKNHSLHFMSFLSSLMTFYMAKWMCVIVAEEIKDTLTHTQWMDIKFRNKNKWLKRL